MADVSYIVKVPARFGPQYRDQLADQTFAKWAEFATGAIELGGKMIKHPSGRLLGATSISSDDDSTTITVSWEEAPEGATLELGSRPIPIGQIMLNRGPTKISKKGYRYRIIPITKRTEEMPLEVSGPQAGQSPVGLPIPNHLTPQQVAETYGFTVAGTRMWEGAHQNRQMERYVKTGGYTQDAVNFRTISDNPGGKRSVSPLGGRAKSYTVDRSKGVFGGQAWVIPSMIAYHPMRVLASWADQRANA